MSTAASASCIISERSLFNLLDARGSISVTERMGYIKRIRDTARACADGYLKARSKAGWPLLQRDWKVGAHPAVVEGGLASSAWERFGEGAAP
jgi:glycyl-tRNA synthetase alpha chain